MKFLEDFEPGQVIRFHSEPLSVEAIKAFAYEWDPQLLHTDEAHATSVHGSLIASGFQTMLQVFKPIMSELMADVANIGGLGLDNVRWLRPVRPGEALETELVVNSVTPSRSKADRGVLHYSLRTTNPSGEVVFTADTPVMIKRKPTQGQ